MLKFFTKMNKKKITEFEMKQSILKNPHHLWLKDAPFVSKVIETYIDSLPFHVIEFMHNHKVTLVRSNGRFSAAVSADREVILVMPDLFNLLNSYGFETGLMILSHELGHLIFEHNKTEIDPLDAQVAADQFACDQGFAEELEKFLHNLSENTEKRVRIAYVTSYRMKHEQSA